MIKDKTPLPLMGEVINKLKEAKYFNKLDLICGYSNVWIQEGDEWKAAFLMNKGLFEPQVMYFRLCNSSDILKDDEQYLLGITPWRSIGKLYGQFHDTNKNKKGTRRKDNPILKDSRRA